jgi:hypothetical protein
VKSENKSEINLRLNTINEELEKLRKDLAEEIPEKSPE